MRQAGCPSHVGIALLDFEPLPDGRPGYHFVNALSEEVTDRYDDYLADYVDALDTGIRLHLAGACFADLESSENGTPSPEAFAVGLDAGVRLGGLVDAPIIAVRVFLREIMISAVDSSEYAFRRAGWLGAQRAVELDG